MQIVYLADCPLHVSLLAEWCHEQWGYLSPKRTLKEVENKFADLLNIDKIPFALVAVENEKPIAMASLTVNDMDTYPELTPWLASVYVVPEFRKKGIGKKIVQSVLEKAKEQQFQKVYLFTMDQEHWYAQMGFQVLEKTTYHDENVTVMICDVALLC